MFFSFARVLTVNLVQKENQENQVQRVRQGLLVLREWQENLELR